jgi:hypothetical protein
LLVEETSQQLNFLPVDCDAQEVTVFSMGGSAEGCAQQVVVCVACSAATAASV